MKTITVEVPDNFPKSELDKYEAEVYPDGSLRIRVKPKPVRFKTNHSSDYVCSAPEIFDALCEYRGRGLYLDSAYRWELVKNSAGETILVAFKKEKPE